MTCRELASSTNIPLDELKRHLISLATPKFKILNRTGKTKEVDESESFSVNTDFTSKLIKVKVWQVSAALFVDVGHCGVFVADPVGYAAFHRSRAC